MASEIRFIWEPEGNPSGGPEEWGWPQKDIDKFRETEHEVERCLAQRKCPCCERWLTVVSLHDIWDADDRYRRDVEDDLARDARRWKCKGDR